MKKLLCFDLDDTLLATDKSISEENKQAIRRAADEGNYVSIVSGRSKRGSSFVAEELGMIGRKNCFLIAFQGNLIWDYENDRCVYMDGIPLDDGIRLLNEISDAGFYTQTYTADEMLIPGICEEFEHYNSIVHEKHRIIPSWDELTEPTLPKIMAIDYHDYERLKRFREHFLTLNYADRFDCFFSSTDYLEFCKRDSNKGHGVKKLAEYLQVDVKNVVTIGDERNDISMLTYAGVGVAMNNAHHSVKKYADYITSNDNDHSGVAEVIRKFILNEEQ